MMIIDHVAMAVSHRVVAMRVGMWLRAVPASMFMLVMFVVRVLVGMVHVCGLQLGPALLAADTRNQQRRTM